MTTLAPELVEQRAAVFARLQEHLGDRDGHDQSIPGADPYGRWTVYGESNKGLGPSLVRASSLERGQMVAEAMLPWDFEPRAIYDLDTLDGDEPEPQAVLYSGMHWAVLEADADGLGLLLTRPDGGQTITQLEHCEVLNHAPDERLPRRFEVAAIVHNVIFNTVAS